MDQPLIKLSKITKTYFPGKDNEFQALKGIDLDVNQGDFISIMGPSGSGKSTVMNILGALDVPTSGSYLVKGKNIEQMNAAELAEFRNQDVGFIFQQFNLLPRASVLENVLLPTIYGEIDNPQTKALNLLEKVGLADKLDNQPNQLSGGQMQRVAIARALIMSPSIIMADEPTGNLDSKTAKEIMDILQELHTEGNTIVLITHDANVAKHADRTIHIKDGKILTK